MEADAILTDQTLAADQTFDTLKAQDTRTERRIFWHEVAIIHITALLVAAYLVALLIRVGAVQVPLW